MQNKKHIIWVWGEMCILLLIVLGTIILANNSIYAQEDIRRQIPLTPKDEAQDAYIQSTRIRMTNGQNALSVSINPWGVGEIINPASGVYIWRLRASDGHRQGVVTIHWQDSDGIWGQQAFSYQVINIPPTANVTISNNEVLVNEVVMVNFSNIYDPSPEDTEAGFNYLVDCDNDGILDTQGTLPNGLQCQYAEAGIYTLHAYIQDKDGGQSEVITHNVLVIEIPSSPRCVAPNPELDLSGFIRNGGTVGEVTNTSATCSHTIGMASYHKYDEVIDRQVIYDYMTATIEPGQTLNLNIALPNCATQIDLFYGDVIMSFAGGIRYGDRLLDALHPEGLSYCTEADIGSSEDDLSISSNSWQPACDITDGRVNADSARDCSAPVTVYCSDGNIDIWRIDPQTSGGVLWLRVDSSLIETVGIPESENAILFIQDNLGVYRLTTGEFQVNVTQYDPYAENNISTYITIWDEC